MVVSKEVADATKRKAAIIGMQLKNALMWLLTHIKVEAQAGVLRIWSEIERDDGEALRNIAACRAVLHSHVPKVYRRLLEMTDAVVGFDENIAIVGPEWAKKTKSNQAFDSGSGTDDTEDQ